MDEHQQREVLSTAIRIVDGRTLFKISNESRQMKTASRSFGLSRFDAIARGSSGCAQIRGRVGGAACALDSRKAGSVHAKPEPCGIQGSRLSRQSIDSSVSGRHTVRWAIMFHCVSLGSATHTTLVCVVVSCSSSRTTTLEQPPNKAIHRSGNVASCSQREVRSNVTGE